MQPVRALLLTDVVDSTQLSEALGDARMAEVWAAHDRVARDLLPAHRGLEIDKTDGFLMLFESADDAVAYAIAYHRAIAGIDPPLKARAGLHVGPVILRENPSDDVARGAKPLEVDGLAKPTAARVMSLAIGGQTLLTPDARAALGPTDLRVESHGHWRMKGVSDPIELFEIGEPDAPFRPPPTSAKVYRVVETEHGWRPVHDVPHTLPAERDPFVGRTASLLELSRCLDDGERLVSILGPGGAGKTRLALHYGWTWLGDWPGGIWFCDLGDAHHPDDAVALLAATLDVPLHKGDPIELMGDAIAGRGRCLVVLDTFEPIAEHAAGLLGPWLDRAPEAAFLVTTRQLLGLRGERALNLEPLEPDEALELFTARARAVNPDFDPKPHHAACRKLVALLDRLPLAIELAAARSRILPPEQLLQRMSRRFELLSSSGSRTDRQATLRATLDWSWDLLDPSEQTALAQVSVFEGGFSLQAAESVLDLGEGSVWPMDAIQSLVDRSLVRARDDRFDLLVSVKEYASARLAATGTVAEVQARHGAVFAELPADRSAVELQNLIAACERAVEAGSEAIALPCLETAWSVLSRTGPFSRGIRLAVAVLGICAEPERHARAAYVAGQAAHAGGHVDQAWDLTSRALDEFTALGVDRWIGEARGRLGTIRVEQGRFDEAAPLIERALDELTAVGDTAGCARMHSHLGILWGYRDPARGVSHYERAIALAREVGDLLTEATAAVNVAGIHYRMADYDTAEAELRRGLDLVRSAGHRRNEAHILANLGAIYLERQRFDYAHDCFRASLTLHRRMGNRRGVGTTFTKLAYLFQERGDHEQALVHYEAGLGVCREVGNRHSEGITLGNLGALYLKLGRLAEARDALEQALALHREVGGRLFEGQTLNALGRLTVAEGRPDEGRELLEQALAILREIGNARYEGKTMVDLAALHVVEGRLGVARMALGIAETLLTEGGFQAELADLRLVEAELDAREGR